MMVHYRYSSNRSTIAGKETVMLKGDHIAEDFQALLDAYVARTYQRGAARLVEAQPVERAVIPIKAA